jgi:hypothetical protein
MKPNTYPGILETRMYSPASMLKAYLRQMGIVPILERQPLFSPEVLGYGMVGYFGGRSECRIRRTIVPVTYLDFTAMYPTVMSLIDVWSFVIAEFINVSDDTERVQHLLDTVDAEACFSPSFWPQLTTLVELVPNDDVLPVRARYGQGDSWQIGVNPFTSEEPRWYALADVVASKLLRGKVPRIRRALQLRPQGMQYGLRPIMFRGYVEIDPERDDFFVKLIEERKRVERSEEIPVEERLWLESGLKTTVSSAYGVFAEMRRRDGVSTDVVVYANESPFIAPDATLEQPGPFCFPTLAACISSGARLMLGLLEREVAERGGGTYAFCDTDSMAIVSTRERSLVPCEGGPFGVGGRQSIQALSFKEVDEIRDSFMSLSPYDRELVPSLLKLERFNFSKDTGRRQQLFCDAVSAKRYCLFNLEGSGPVIRDPKGHGLGHLLNPVDPTDTGDEWIETIWLMIIREDLGQRSEEPAWFGRIAASRFSASSAYVLRAFQEFNKDLSYEDQIKPFNFLLAVQVAPLGYPAGYGPKTDQRLHLIAPWEPDPRKWLQLHWVDVHSGKVFGLTTDDTEYSEDTVRARTYRDVFHAYGMHDEPKSLAPEQDQCETQDEDS